MKRLVLIFFLSLSFMGKSDVNDQNRWFLKPAGQAVQVDIDDIHTETIYATPQMDWGFSAIQNIIPQRKVKIAIIDGGIDIDHKAVSYTHLTLPTI